MPRGKRATTGSTGRRNASKRSQGVSAMTNTPEGNRSQGVSAMTTSAVTLKPNEINTLKKYSTKYRVQIKLGSKRFDLPIEGSLLQSDEKGLFTFVSIPNYTGIFGITSNGAEPIKASEKDAAMKALKSAGRAGNADGGSGKAGIEIPPEIQEALKKLPKGTRLVVEAGGTPKLQKLRAKRA